MWKKVILGTLFAGLVTILVVGAVNRTVAKSADRNTDQQNVSGPRWAQAQGGNQLISDQPRGGNGGGGQGRQAEANSSNAQQSQASGQRRGGQVQDADSRGGGQGRQGQNAETQAPWQTIQGTVVGVDEAGMTLQTADGEIEIADRAWRFAQESGFGARVGDRVQLRAYFDGDILEVGDISNLSTQQQVQVREESGRPLWAGGSRGGQGQGTSGNGQASGPIAETEDHDWQTIEGAVISVDQQQMTVRTAEGDIQIADRPWDFAQSAGFTVQVGETVSMTGFYEDGTFEVGTLATGSQQVQVREESGRPLWAGGGGRWR
jgi:RNase P/RNase MRP subunit p29